MSPIEAAMVDELNGELRDATADYRFLEALRAAVRHTSRITGRQMSANQPCILLVCTAISRAYHALGQAQDSCQHKARCKTVSLVCWDSEPAAPYCSLKQTSRSDDGQPTLHCCVAIK